MISPFLQENQLHTLALFFASCGVFFNCDLLKL